MSINATALRPSNPQFPVYIVSKGRWEERQTSRALDKMRVPYFVIVEENEFEKYAQGIDRSKLLVLDPAYQRDYDTFDDLGDSKGKGPGPARNFAWDHSIANGASWHWVMDDNIKSFHRYNRNLKVPVSDGAIFRCMEDFCQRYTNVAMAGPVYWMFIWRKYGTIPPFIVNTRIYSCNLIRNDLGNIRWRGRYNEDTDLSVRLLKAGWCTIQFEAFIQYKEMTQSKRGGNTDEFYLKEGTLPKSQMLVAMHPDVTKLVHRFKRWHHHINYKQHFTHPLIRRDDIETKTGVDNYGMVFHGAPS